MIPRHKKILALITLCSITRMTVPIGAQPKGSGKYAIELVVTRDGRSFETDANILFSDRTVRIVPDKSRLQPETREFAYSEIKAADQSYAKKPLFSVGGGLTTVVLTSLILPFAAIPFLFIKKKKHWMTIQTEKGYAVLKLGDKNFRQIAAEFRTRGVNVNDLGKAEH